MTEPGIETSPRKPSLFAIAALVLVFIALSTLAWQWLNTRQRFTQLEQVLTQRLEQYGADNQRSLALSKNADERSAETLARITLLEQKLAESRDQQETLQTLYLELANTREERVIAEVEQLMIIANQQLQLAGNVKPALLALRSADSRLQHLDTPRAIQLRKAITQDIARLQSLPLVDVTGINLKLENLISNVDRLPMVSERRAAPASAPGPDSSVSPLPASASGSALRLVQEIWQDIKGVVRLERIDRPEPPLLAPDQAFFLRENIKLRLLTARIALLQHDEATYRADLSAAEQWIKDYFDAREAATRSALSTIKQLSASSVVIQMPDIGESLDLVSSYKLALERD